jgi:hypothetical protein
VDFVKPWSIIELKPHDHVNKTGKERRGVTHHLMLLHQKGQKCNNLERQRRGLLA